MSKQTLQSWCDQIKRRTGSDPETEASVQESLMYAVAGLRCALEYRSARDFDHTFFCRSSIEVNKALLTPDGLRELAEWTPSMPETSI